MKTKVLIIISVAALLVSCKENNWLSWKAQNEYWLEQNKITHQDDPNFHVTEDGLQYRIIADDGAQWGETRPSMNSVVICDYEGRLINGHTFDSGNNASFALQSVIKGFAQGLQKIHTHGDIEIYIPYYLGYDQMAYDRKELHKAEGNGTEGTASYIPPYSTLIFRVHLSSVVN